MEPAGPILVEGLFRDLQGRLVQMLRGLTDEDWVRPAGPPAESRQVRDLAAHSLAIDLRRLSADRDGEGARPPDAAADALWIEAMRRLSRRALLELIEITGDRAVIYLENLESYEKSSLAVAWPDAAEVWLDQARELAAKWRAQQLIREAVGAPTLAGPRFLRPVIDVGLRGLPARLEPSVADASVVVEIVGLAGGVWTITGGRLFVGAPEDPTGRLTAEQDPAWRWLLGATDPETIREAAVVEGRSELVESLFRTNAQEPHAIHRL